MLVVLEGIDGSGKSSLARHLVRTLEAEGYRAVRTQEPTHGPIGTRLREAAARGLRFEPQEELRLFMEDRAEHVRHTVRPALDQGQVVVQDRSFYSTAAYQGQRGLDRAHILEEGRKIAPEPDLLFVLDLPVETALARLEGRGGGLTAFERPDALRELAEFFRSIPTAIRLDADRSETQVLEQAWGWIFSRLS